MREVVDLLFSNIWWACIKILTHLKVSIKKILLKLIHVCYHNVDIDILWDISTKGFYSSWDLHMDHYM